MHAETITDLPLEVGIFNTVDDATRAVHNLLEADFSAEHITVVCSDDNKEQYFRAFEHQRPAGANAARATIAGGAIGAAVGGASVVVAALATGSIALLATGPITTWAGGIAGGLVGAMMTRGVEKELANFYQQAVLDGQILVAADDPRPDGHKHLARAARILADAGAHPLPLREG